MIHGYIAVGALLVYLLASLGKSLIMSDMFFQPLSALESHVKPSQVASDRSQYCCSYRYRGAHLEVVDVIKAVGKAYLHRVILGGVHELGQLAFQ